MVLFLRGDLEVNEAKLTSFLGEDIHPAVITEESGMQAGFIGPVPYWLRKEPRFCSTVLWRGSQALLRCKQRGLASDRDWTSNGTVRMLFIGILPRPLQAASARSAANGA